MCNVEGVRRHRGLRKKIAISILILYPRYETEVANGEHGFYTDTTVCIGCKACEVACKNGISASTNGGVNNTLSGDSYDTRAPRRIHWRHVNSSSVHRRPQGRPLAADERRGKTRQRSLLEVCPTARRAHRV